MFVPPGHIALVVLRYCSDFAAWAQAQFPTPENGSVNFFKADRCLVLSSACNSTEEVEILKRITIYTKISMSGDTIKTTGKGTGGQIDSKKGSSRGQMQPSPIQDHLPDHQRVLLYTEEAHPTREASGLH